jgi:hypothetical protein
MGTDDSSSVSRQGLVRRAEEIYREAYLRRMKRLNATGWENATLANVEHLQIDDPKLLSALAAIEERLEELRGD